MKELEYKKGGKRLLKTYKGPVFGFFGSPLSDEEVFSEIEHVYNTVQNAEEEYGREIEWDGVVMAPEDQLDYTAVKEPKWEDIDTVRVTSREEFEEMKEKGYTIPYRHAKSQTTHLQSSDGEIKTNVFVKQKTMPVISPVPGPGIPAMLCVDYTFSDDVSHEERMDMKDQVEYSLGGEGYEQEEEDYIPQDDAGDDEEPSDEAPQSMADRISRIFKGD